MVKKVKKGTKQAKKKTAVKKTAKGKADNSRKPVEGKVRKGGRNPAPTTPKPKFKPAGQSPVKGDLGIEYVPIDTIRLNPKNPRRNEETTEDIIRSMKAFGVVWPILVRQNTDTIIAGNNRYRAFQAMGMKTIPVIFRTMDEIDADVLMVTDNKITEKTPWDFPKLADLFVEFDVMNVDMDLTGFSADEIASIAPATFGLGEPDPKDDEVPETPKKAKTKPGDLYLLGDHKLLCGDATKVEDVERLMDGKKAALCLTDPPYGVGWDYESTDDTPENLQRLIDGFMPLATASCGCVLLTPGNRNQWLYPKPVWSLCWHTAAGMGLGPWGFTCWQPILAYGKDPYLAQGKGSRPDSLSLTEASPDVDHPCPKPMKVWSWALERGSVERGDIVYDPFSGSGTTLIAAEKLGRICYGLEIEPKYCDVIVQRWQEYTGQKAKLKR